MSRLIAFGCSLPTQGQALEENIRTVNYFLPHKLAEIMQLDCQQCWTKWC